MPIENIKELCEAICEFNDMMESDHEMEVKKNARYRNDRTLLNIALTGKEQVYKNLLEDFEDIVKFAKTLLYYSEKED